MKFPPFLLFVLLCNSAFAQKDSIRKPRRVHLAVYSAASYQFAMNGNEAESNMGNFGFKGYLQPELGVGIRYQQDSSEFALVTLSAARMIFTLGSSNILTTDTANYGLTNRLDIFMNNFSLEGSYHRKFTTIKNNHYWSWECGVGIHVIQWYGTSTSVDTAAGPFAITRTYTGEKTYALPSAMIGINSTRLPIENKTGFIIGLRTQVYLGKFAEITYNATYTSPNETLEYYFRWAPMIFAPKVYVMAVF